MRHMHLIGSTINIYIYIYRKLVWELNLNMIIGDTYIM